jgi:RimJ/RimL family protein N-acetyltransferase
MAWTLTDNLESYLATAGEFLRSRPVVNTIQLSVLATLQAQGQSAYGSPPLFGWWREPDGLVDGAFMVTPPFPVLLTRLPGQRARLLAEVLAARDTPVSGVNAEQGTAAAFAAAWRELTGLESAVYRRSRLFRLDGIAPPEPRPPGSARVAAAADRELLDSWFEQFYQEVGENVRFPGAVDDRLSHGGLMFWEAGGRLVALAGITRTVAGVARVGPVYTPPDQRNRGYGAAVTVAVSQAALDAGADQVVLFTDLANPTSNALYPRIGYRPVQDSVVLSFAS